MNRFLARRKALRATLATVIGGGLSVLPPGTLAAANRTVTTAGRTRAKAPTAVRLSSRHNGHLGKKVDVPISKLKARTGSHVAKLEFRAASQGANRVGADMNARHTSQPSNRRARLAARAVDKINAHKASKQQFSSLHSTQTDGSFRRVLQNNRARIDAHIASGKKAPLKLIDRSTVPMGVVHSAKTGKTMPANNVSWQLRTAGKRIYPYSAEVF